MLNALTSFYATALITWPSHVFFHSVAACLLLQLSSTMTANKAIEILREHRGGGAIQTVKVILSFLSMCGFKGKIMVHSHVLPH